jgi:hypothetical protein
MGSPKQQPSKVIDINDDGKYDSDIKSTFLRVIEAAGAFKTQHESYLTVVAEVVLTLKKAKDLEPAEVSCLYKSAGFTSILIICLSMRRFFNF